MPICFKRIRAANREPSSTVSHRVIRWSEGKMEGLYVCMCVCECGSGLHKSFENRERVPAYNETMASCSSHQFISVCCLFVYIFSSVWI